MSSKSGINIGRYRYDSLYALLIIAGTLIWVITAVVTSSLYVDRGVIYYFYSGIAIYFIFAAISLFEGISIIKKLSQVFLISGALFMVILSVVSYSLLVISLVILAVAVRRVFIGSNAKGLATGIFGSVAAVILMVLLGALIRFGVSPTSQILVGSIYDDALPQGVPFLFQGALVFFSWHFVVTISLQLIFLYALIGVLVVDNYLLIVRQVRMGGNLGVVGQVSGALSVISCQCETITAAFPAIVSLFISIIVTPLIAESFILLALTNVLLRMRYRVGDHRLFQSFSGKSSLLFVSLAAPFLVVLTVSTVTVIVLMDLQQNLVFFSLSNFLMYLSGFLLFAALLRNVFRYSASKMSWAIPVSFVVLSTVLMLVWFLPALTTEAVSRPDAFAIMGISSFAGGVIMSLAYMLTNRVARDVIVEYVAMMFTMTAIVVFFVTLSLDIRIWPTFSLLEQTQFSVYLWLVSLPVMWFITNLALSRVEEVKPVVSVPA
ncbi:hypothetical protein ApAK_08600 [Thermoplasmatales archaeon AK]|nr:hypothetical protein [Thermoplasmatales archaeon AK]